ncbi:hypothetical protein Tco_0638369 [Tanacetum coccineum]
MSTPTFAKTHNLVAFLDKPAESEGFEQIIDFLNASSIKYALTDVRIQALVDGKKVIVNEASIRYDLRLDDTEGAACLPNDTIFEELARMGAKTTAWNEFSSTMASVIISLANNHKFNFSMYILESMMKNFEGGVKFFMYPRFIQVFINKQLGDMSHHKRIFVNSSHTKNIFTNMKRTGKDFSRVITPLFDTMMIKATEEKKQKSKRKQRKDADFSQDEIPNEESIPTTYNDPLPSGEDRLQLTELMILCTKLQKQVFDLEEAKTVQAKEIASLKKRVKKLEKRRKSRTTELKRLKKVGAASRVESSKDVEASLEVTLIDETQEKIDDRDLFRVNDFNGDEVIVDVSGGEKEEQSSKVVENEVSTTKPVTIAGEVVTTANVEVSAALTATITTDDDELNLAKTLIEIKAAKA